MARGKISFSNTHTTLDEVEDYYVDSEASLNSFFNINLSAGRFRRDSWDILNLSLMKSLRRAKIHSIEILLEILSCY